MEIIARGSAVTRFPVRLPDIQAYPLTAGIDEMLQQLFPRAVVYRQSSPGPRIPSKSKRDPGYLIVK
jgi:hypothetical protein